MATVTSAHPVDLSRHMLSSSTSSSSLERTVSASSSATVHPLDESVTSIKEEKASSSTSSSPTFQSNSSSSNHKTISTTVSSINTAESLSPPLPHNSNTRRMQDKSTTASFNTTSSPTVKNDYSWGGSSRRGRVDSGDRNESDQTRRRRDQWSYDGSQDSEGMYSSLIEEETPMQYPPISGEDKEARVIELNLERWASEEKLRRKAHRTSRIGSGSTTNGTTGMLSKRRSVLGMLSNGRAGGGMAALQQSEGKSEARQENAGRKESWNSAIKEGSSDYDDGNTSMENKSDQAEEGNSEIRRLSKGKAREGSDPFKDPAATVNYSSAKRMSTIKPTSRAPIVTPGSAPTIRHRANERLLKEGGTVEMPSIVATDDDEEKEAVRHLQELVIDPFQSAAEVDQQHRYLLARDAAKKTLLTGADGSPILTTAPPPVMAPIRKSMSSSKFNEIGLDDEDNTLAADWLRGSHTGTTTQQEESEQRKSWWTEWLCGCDNIEEEDDQQSGRTMPG